MKAPDPMRAGGLALVAAAVLAAATATAAAQARGKPGPYARLDNVKVAEALGELGMAAALEGLKAHLEKSGDVLGSKAAAAQLEAVKAARLTGPENDRKRRAALERAADLLRQAVATPPGEDADAGQWISFWRLRYMLAKLLAEGIGQPIADRLLYLAEEPDDRVELERLTAEATQQLDLLKLSLDDHVRTWGGDITGIISILPQVNKFRQEPMFIFHTGWIRMLRGLSLPPKSAVADAKAKADAAEAATDAAKRTALLVEAIRRLGAPLEPAGEAALGDVARAAEALRRVLAFQPKGDDDAKQLERLFRRAESAIGRIEWARSAQINAAISEVERLAGVKQEVAIKYWSRLLQGIASRLLDQHDAAAGYFAAIRTAVERGGEARDAAAGVVRTALFQAARNEIDRPRPDGAAVTEAIGEFLRTALAQSGDDQQAQDRAEVQAALLRCYFHERLADAAMREGHRAAAAAHQLDAAAAMFTFEDRYETLAKEVARLQAAGKPYEREQQKLSRLSGLQVWLFTVLARRYERRLGEDEPSPVFQSAVRLAVVVRQLTEADSDTDREKALALLEKILEPEAPTTQPAGGGGAATRPAGTERERTLARRIAVTARWQAAQAIMPRWYPEKVNRVVDLRQEIARLKQTGGDTVAEEAELKQAVAELAEAGPKRWPKVRRAAALWLGIADAHPDHPLAFAAASRAVNELSNLRKERLAADSPPGKDFEKQYFEALQALVGGWGDRPEVDAWKSELAWLKREMQKAGGENYDPTSLKLGIDAISAFEATPKSNLLRYLDDKYAALNDRHDLLEKKDRWLRGLEDSSLPEPQRKALSDALAKLTDLDRLIADLDAYSSDALAAAQRVADEQRRETLSLRASWSALVAAEMLWNKGRRAADPQAKKRALEKVRWVKQHWQGTPEERRARLKETQWELEDGVAGAAEKLIRIIEENPKDAEYLLSEVYDQLRKTGERIEDMRVLEQRGTKQWQAAAQSYSKFARFIYDYARKEDLPEEDRYEATRRYADALAAIGDDPGALKVWLEAKAMDEDRKDEQKQQIVKQKEEWLKRLEAADGNVAGLRQLGRDVLDEFKQRGVLTVSSRALQLLRRVDREEDAGTLAELIARACDSYAAVAVQYLASDSVVLRGLARAYQKLGKYAEALPLWDQIRGSLKPTDPAYWDTQLQYVTCMLEVYRADKTALKGLISYIEQIGAADRLRFKAVADRARQLSGA